MLSQIGQAQKVVPFTLACLQKAGDVALRSDVIFEFDEFVVLPNDAGGSMCGLAVSLQMDG